MRIAYLFSRYPIVSQTFCDTEMLALERMGVELELYSIYPPPTSFRHGHASRLKAEIHYAPPSPILKLGENAAKKAGRWPDEFIAQQLKKYGPDYKPELRARNALYFADLFEARGITHFHVHFANRAAHTAVFIKAISGIPYSMSTHGQDFMVDLGNNDLLREICHEAEFVANETEFSKNLVAGLCPESAGKMLRVFNGMDLSNFPAPTASTCNPVPRIVSIGRLIEFKGFHHLISACAKLRWRELKFTCDIIGEGPWRPQLQEKIDELGLQDCVRLTGALPQEEVFTALRTCDIFALACIVDAHGASDVFPTVILEAMASAKPVVSTRLAGVPEQIVDDRSGLLVEPGDETALADALDRVIRSADHRRMFGQSARERLEREFAVEHTVLPLHALFEKHVKASPAPLPREAGLACLLWNWPPLREAETELAEICKAQPAARIYVSHAQGADPAEAARAILSRCDFLPDGMVLEGEWQQERDMARRIETWRADLGQKLSSEIFLQQARHALYLKKWVQRDGIRHLHVTGALELLTAWILRKLCAVTISATLGKELTLPTSVVAQLAKECVGVRLTVKNMELVMHFEKDRKGRFYLPPRGRFARGIEPEWLPKLAEWSRPAIK